jgi:DNA polymerase-2
VCSSDLVLLKTQEIGESMGLELIHGIVDSVWLKCKGGISYSDVAEFCKRVTSAVNIDMSPKGIYRWMVIPSSRLHSTIAPLNRYYGVYRNGAIKTRGIEVRRRDTCLFVGDCQETMIKILAHGRDKKGFIDMIPRAYAVCQSYIDRLRQGDVDLRDLVLHSRLTRNPQEYRAVSRTALVAQQLLKSGRELHAGQKVRYLLVQPGADSTVRRVTALELFDSSTKYDPEAYGNLCMRAFESLIPVQYLNLEKLNKTESSVCITT